MSGFDGANGTSCDAQSKQVDGNSSILTNGQGIGLAVSILPSII